MILSSLALCKYLFLHLSFVIIIMALHKSYRTTTRFFKNPSNYVLKTPDT